jgi:hypothetical protein
VSLLVPNDKFDVKLKIIVVRRAERGIKPSSPQTKELTRWVTKNIGLRWRNKVIYNFKEVKIIIKKVTLEFNPALLKPMQLF